MAVDLTPEQQVLVSQGSATVEQGGKTIRVFGKIGTLEYFGFVPDLGAFDISASGVSKSINRKAGKRSRWFGDTVGTSFKASTAEVILYKGRRGSSLPGEPIQLKDLDNKQTWTLQVDGPIGHLIAWMTANRPQVNVQIYGKRGKKYLGKLSADGYTPPALPGG